MILSLLMGAEKSSWPVFSVLKKFYGWEEDLVMHKMINESRQKVFMATKVQKMMKNSSRILIYPTLALKKITFPLFDVVAITQLLIRLSCRFRFFHGVHLVLVCRCHLRALFVLLTRPTMTIALLNAFT